MGFVSNVVIKCLYEVRNLLSNVMTTSLSVMATFKHVSSSIKNFTLWIWSRMLSASCILIVKNLCLKIKMFNKLLMSWMFHRGFQAFAGHSQCLICAISLLTKLIATSPNMVLDCFSNVFLSFTSVLDGGASSDSLTISYRSCEANIISILNFQKLKLSALNLPMILSPLLSLDAMVEF